MSDQKIALSSHPIVTCPPQISNCDITPKSVKYFENHCLNYFINAKGSIHNNLKVSCILGCFENDLVNDWVSVDRDQIITLTFPAFMVEFRACWLPYDWEQSLCSKILSAQLFPKKQCFKDWASSLQSLNVSLQGTSSHLDDALSPTVTYLEIKIASQMPFPNLQNLPHRLLPQYSDLHMQRIHLPLSNLMTISSQPSNMDILTTLSLPNYLVPPPVWNLFKRKMTTGLSTTTWLFQT